MKSERQLGKQYSIKQHAISARNVTDLQQAKVFLVRIDIVQNGIWRVKHLQMRRKSIHNYSTYPNKHRRNILSNDTGVLTVSVRILTLNVCQYRKVLQTIPIGKYEYCLVTEDQVAEVRG